MLISFRSDFVGTDKNLCYWFLFSIFWGIFKEFNGALKFIRCDCVGWSLNGQTFGNFCLKIADILQKHFLQGNCRKKLKVNRFCLQIGTVGVLRNVQNFTNSKMLWLVDKWPKLWQLLPKNCWYFLLETFHCNLQVLNKTYFTILSILTILSNIHITDQFFSGKILRRKNGVKPFSQRSGSDEFLTNWTNL